MLTQNYPLGSDSVLVGARRESGRHLRVEQLINEPVLTNRHVGSDSAWAMKLKLCMDAVAQKYQIPVISARATQCYDREDPRDMCFTVQTACGELEVIRNRAGEHEFHWKQAC